MNNRKFTTLILAMGLTFLSQQIGSAQSMSTKVDPFNKVIVSPHIQVTFQQGDSESVTIESSTVSDDKINIETIGKTLRIYLDGAKEVTKTEKIVENGNEQRKPIYQGTVLIATVTYVNLDELSLRGEEKFVCKSTLTSDRFRLNIFGESQVYLDEVALGTLQATIYGESYLELKAGKVDRLRMTAYGQSKVNTLGVESNSARITAYGEASFRLKVVDELRVTAYGEAMVEYQGNPTVKKGIIIGEATVNKIE